CGLRCLCVLLCFFFQAEDGIRDDLVTGVQTCALPISLEVPRRREARAAGLESGARRLRLAAGDLHALVAEDVVEDAQRPQKSFRSPCRRSVSSGTRMS